MTEAAIYTDSPENSGEELSPFGAYELACSGLRYVNSLNGEVGKAQKAALIAAAECEVDRAAGTAREALAAKRTTFDNQTLDQAAFLSVQRGEAADVTHARAENLRLFANTRARTGQPLVVCGRDGLWRGGIIMHPPALVADSNRDLYLGLRVGTKFGHDAEMTYYSVRQAAAKRADGRIEDSNRIAVAHSEIATRVGEVMQYGIASESRGLAHRLRAVTELSSLLSVLPRLDMHVRDCKVSAPEIDRACTILMDTFLSRGVTDDQLRTIPLALFAADPSRLPALKEGVVRMIWPGELPLSTMLLRTTFAGDGFARFTHIVAAQQPGQGSEATMLDAMAELASLLKKRVG